MPALLLPGCPDHLPALGSQPLVWSLDAQEIDLTSIQEYLGQIQPPPEYLLGSADTPVLYWLLTAHQFPQAQSLCFTAVQGWWSVQTGQVWTASAVPVKAPLGVSSKAHSEKPKSPTQEDSVSQWLNSRLIAEAFQKEAWGGRRKTEFQRRLEEVEEELWRRVEQQPKLAYLVDKMRQARRDGESAYELNQQLSQRLKRGEKGEALDQWISQVAQGLHTNVVKHLQTSVQKWHKRQHALATRHEGSVSRYRSSLSPVEILEGASHPNSLRHQPPASQWTLLLDETGEDFEGNGSEQDGFRKQGRLIALAIPKGVSLPARADFHAVERPAIEVDQVLADLLQAQVGVFGFSVQDPSTTASNWMAHMHHLIRWVLLQLPLSSEQTPEIEVRIEQRGTYNATTSLTALTEVLESEFRSVHSRFAALRLKLHFMDKHDPLNGYVDTLAFTWGSSSRESVDRLKRSALLGHCLLRPTDQGLERLYLALTAGQRLLSAEWYALCAVEDPIMVDFLAQLGKGVCQQPRLWRSYLEEVRQHLRLKDFRLHELNQALSWLERWAPDGAVFPPLLRLTLESARLATENHLGQLNPARITICLELSRTLRDEAAPDCCEALLRLVSATTNTFEFKLLHPVLEDWIMQPVAVPGVLNYGKLLSSLGQLHAFSGDWAAADQCFTRALAHLARLSDSQQARREQQQTRIYQVLARMDNPAYSTAAAWGEVQEVLHDALGIQDLSIQSSSEAISRTLAGSTQELRYLHYLWLRALVQLPEAQDAVQNYLQQSSDWQKGEDHPWGLINAYRGWLLHQAGQQQQASLWMQQGILTCSQSAHGPILLWMAEVLRTLAQTLALEDVERPTVEQRHRLISQLPLAPHAALEVFAQQQPIEPTQVRKHIQCCLPFSFH